MSNVKKWFKKPPPKFWSTQEEFKLSVTWGGGVKIVRIESNEGR